MHYLKQQDVLVEILRTGPCPLHSVCPCVTVSAATDGMKHLFDTHTISTNNCTGGCVVRVGDVLGDMLQDVDDTSR